MVEVLAQLYFQAKDYAKAAAWATQYLKDGGTNAGDALAADPVASTLPTIARTRRASCARLSTRTQRPARRRSWSACSCWRAVTPSSATTPGLPSRWRSCSSTTRAGNTGPRPSVASKPGPASPSGCSSTCCGCGRPPALCGGTADYAAMAQLALAAGVAGRGETDFRSGLRVGRAGHGRRGRAAAAGARHGGEADGRGREAAPAEREVRRRHGRRDRAGQRRLRLCERRPVRQRPRADGAGHARRAA